jgi:integrase
MPSTSATTSTEEPRVLASPQESSEKCLPSHPSRGHPKPVRRRSSLTIEQAVQIYLEEQRKSKRRSKTLEWHQTALRFFEQYLRSECQCIGIDQITETQVRGWLASLCETPTARGMRRSTGTRESYARSARAFCQWLVRRRYVKQTPFAHLIIPKGNPPPLHLLEPEEWERLLQACRPIGGKPILAEQAAARNQAILWVLAETEMRTAEVCGLRISDVDREH